MSPHIRIAEQDSLAEGASISSIVDRGFPAPLTIGGPPLLVTTIDAEEEFDWSQPLTRTDHIVQSMRMQAPAHKIFEKHGIIPAYFLTYPVLNHEEGYRPLLEYFQDGKCEIGTQLHPWVTPPFLEPLNSENSFPGNLPLQLEYEKISLLTEAISERFQARPRFYRAGRYGVGPRTGAILKSLGYYVDSSVVPEHGFRREGGPEFFGFPASPYWADREKTLLELPITAGYLGMFSHGNRSLLHSLFSMPGRHKMTRAVTARLGLVERIRLTPEGTKFGDAQRLVRALAKRGTRIFTLSYHSPSLVPGATPYVRSMKDRDRLLDWLDSFYGFFRQELGGRPAAISDVFEMARSARE